MLIPNPILFGKTPPGGAVLPVTGDRGGLAGYIMLGLSGPEAAVEIGRGLSDWQPVTYPHVLSSGEQLRLTRSDSSATMTTLHMLAPIDDGPPPEIPLGTVTLENDQPVLTTILAPQGPLDPMTAFEMLLPPNVADLRVSARGSREVLVIIARTLDPSTDPDAQSGPGSDPVVARVVAPGSGVWYAICIATGGGPVEGVTVTASWSTGGAGPLTVSADLEGYQTIQDAEASTDMATGYQTIQGAAATADADGFETVERS